MPAAQVSEACGSRSTSSTRWPCSTSAAPSEWTVVVLATPPFWLATASTTGMGATLTAPVAGRQWPRPCAHRPVMVVARCPRRPARAPARARRAPGRLRAEVGQADRLVHRRQADDLPARRHGAGRRRPPRRCCPRARTALGGLTMGADAAAFCTAGDRHHPGPAAQGLQRPQGGQGPRRRRPDRRRPRPRRPRGRSPRTPSPAASRCSRPPRWSRRPAPRSCCSLPVVDRGGTCAAMAAERGYEFRALVTAEDLGFPYEKDV